MHLLYFLGSFYPAQDGGPNNSLYWLSKNVAKNKSVHNVTVLSFFKNITEKDQKKFKIYPNKLIKFQKLNVIYCKYYFFRILSPYFFYFLFFKTRKFNLVHLNSIFFYINLICIFFLIC